MPGARRVEFRLHVRQGALTVTVLDAEARTPILPSVALAWQSMFPTPDRDALRVLARFESGNPRHPAVDVRGEDVAELLPLLEGQRVLLEPALMQLRFSDEPVKPRFDLELVGGDTIIVKTSFERASDRRRFSLLQGGWFEGWPSWQIDTQEGIARRVDKRVSPAAMRRLLRSPTIGEPMRELGRLIMQGLPKVAAGDRRGAAGAQPDRGGRRSGPHLPDARRRLAGRGARRALRGLRRRGDPGPRRRHHPARAHPAAARRG